VLTFQEAIASAADLPVHALLPEFSQAFTPGSVSVVSASAGSGKTTLIPLACADLIASGQRVIVCSPRPTFLFFRREDIATFFVSEV